MFLKSHHRPCCQVQAALPPPPQSQVGVIIIISWCQLCGLHDSRVSTVSNEHANLLPGPIHVPSGTQKMMIIIQMQQRPQINWCHFCHFSTGIKTEYSSHSLGQGAHMPAPLQGPRPIRESGSVTGSCCRRPCPCTWRPPSHRIVTEGLRPWLPQVNIYQGRVLGTVDGSECSVLCADVLFCY